MHNTQNFYFELRRDIFLAEWLVGVGDTEDPPNDNFSSGFRQREMRLTFEMSFHSTS